MKHKTQTREQSVAFGLKQRKRMKRVELAEFHPAEHRDAMEALRASCVGRVKELLPLKFKRMLASPFAFFRGSAPVMAADLASNKHTNLACQLGGDAHISNFGYFATLGDKVIFDMNDFDETLRGPWEWDVKRMAVSVVLSARENGGSDARIRAILHLFFDQYCDWVRLFSAMPALDVARHRVHRNVNDLVLVGALAKAERASPAHNLQKFCIKRDRKWQFRNVRDVLWCVGGKTRKAVLQALAAYRETLAPERQLIFDHYRVADVGFKVVGVGSVGTRDYIVLMFGADENDPLIMQIKEEPLSAYAPYLATAGLSEVELGGTGSFHQGRRVVYGQRALQLLSDPLLGWTTMDGRDYLVRQLNDHKYSVDPCELRAGHLEEYVRICAELLAKGHCRSGDPIAIASYLGNTSKASLNLVKFAFVYAAQVENDYIEFKKAIRSGVLKKIDRST